MLYDHQIIFPFCFSKLEKCFLNVFALRIKRQQFLIYFISSFYEEEEEEQKKLPTFHNSLNIFFFVLKQIKTTLCSIYIMKILLYLFTLGAREVRGGAQRETFPLFFPTAILIFPSFF